MGKLRFVGLDVHKSSIVIAVADMDGGVPSVVATVLNDTGLLLKKLKKLGSSDELRCCYEAGPTGFGLSRALQAAGAAVHSGGPFVGAQTGGRSGEDRPARRRQARAFSA
jgi:hypothetical protein